VLVFDDSRSPRANLGKDFIVNESKQEIVLTLARDYFTPAFQEAIRQASKDNYKAGDILNGIMNAYLQMLLAVYQNDDIVSGLLGAQAEYIKKLIPPQCH
jgi:hypothetical protein